MSAKLAIIRNFVADGLRQEFGLDAKVEAARHKALDSRTMPAVLVYTDSESVTKTRALAPRFRLYVREVELNIEIVTDGGKGKNLGSEIADDLDALCERVEAWMFPREEQEGIWVECLYKRSDGAIAQESDNPAATRTLVFSVEYHDQAPKPRAEELGPFSTLHVEQDLAPSDGQIDAEDTVEIPQ